MRYLLLFVLVLATPAWAQDAMLQFEITSALQSGAKAWNRGDLDAFMNDYVRSDDMTYTAAGKVVRGFDALKKRYQDKYGSDRDSMGHLDFEDIEVWRLGDDHALALGRWILKRQSQDTVEGVFSLVFRKEKGGWKILHDHTSSKE